MATTAQSSGSAEDGPYPGHPPAPTGGGWLPPSWTGGLLAGTAEATKLRQRAQTPLQLLSVAVRVKLEAPDCDPSAPEVLFCFTSQNSAVFVSPPGAEHNYGLTREFTIRTVAFGAIPVEARVQLEQRRDQQGRPLYTTFETSDVYRMGGPYLPPGRPDRFYYDTTVEDALFLRINGLRVDGRKIELAGPCRTAEPGRLLLHGKGFWQGNPEVDPNGPVWDSGHYVAGRGGLLSGSLDIRPFATCPTVAGDDLATLLTAMVSAPGNPVAIHVTGPTCSWPPVRQDPGLPPTPGQDHDVADFEESGCIPIPHAPASPRRGGG